LNRDKITEKVLEKLGQVKGVGATTLLSSEERETIRKMEEKADQMTLMGLGRGDNQGAKKVLDMDVLVSFLTDMDYEWPCSPNVILKHKDKKVGEDTENTERIKEVEKSADSLVIGNIIIYDKGVLMEANSSKEPLVVILPPKQCESVSCIEGISDAILASPSPPTDEYLKERMCEKNERGSGTFLLGFDFENKD
jgi:hypothetical protein